jgi:FtsH-binding integral membrane protein
MSEIIDQGQSGYAKEISREFFRSVYGYMFGALAISGLLASYFGTEEFYKMYFQTANGGMSPLLWVVILAPLGLGLIIGNAYNRLSFGILLCLFILYSALMGIGLSVLFLHYDLIQL